MNTTTLPQAVHTEKSTSTENFTALTGPMNSAGIGHTFFGVFLTALTSIKARPAYQYSDDGVSWDSPVGVDLASSPNEYASSEGWTLKTTSVDISSSTCKNFVRFGVMAVNTSGSNVESAQVRIALKVVNIPHGTDTFGPVKVNTQASISTPSFTVVSDAMSARNITALRRTLELASSSGAVTLGAGYQVSDDGISWESNAGTADSYTALSSTISSETIDYDSSFSSVTPAKQYIRYVVYAKNSSATGQVEACQATLRIDWR